MTDVAHTGKTTFLALARTAGGGWGYALSSLADRQESMSGSWPSIRGVGVPVHDLRKLIGQRADEKTALVTVFDGDLDDPVQVTELRCRLIFALAGRIVVGEVIHQATRAALGRRDPTVASETPEARALAVLRACSTDPGGAASESSVGAPASRRPNEVLLTRSMLRKIVPVTDMTLWRWLKKGTFPKPIKFASRNYWRASEVQAWLDGRTAERPAVVGAAGPPAA